MPPLVPLFALDTPAGATIALVNTAKGGANAATVATGAFIATTGNAIIVGITAATKLATTVTDTAGNTYTKAIEDNSQTGANNSIWYSLNITGNAANVVTAGFGGTFGDCNIAIHQVSGLGATGTLDIIKSGFNNTGAGLSTGASSATTQANEYVFVVGAANSTQTWTVGPTFANLVTSTSGTQVLATEGKVLTATGVQTGTFTMSASGVWGATLATFSNASPPPATATGATMLLMGV